MEFRLVAAGLASLRADARIRRGCRGLGALGHAGRPRAAAGRQRRRRPPRRRRRGRRRAEVFHPDAVVSTGFCGALDPALAVADVVVATERGGGGPAATDALPVSSAAASPQRRGLLDRPRGANGAEEKRRLRAGGAMAVEMEAAGVAARAQARGLPFYCVRAVTDLAGETMANDFNAALRRTATSIQW